jgi:hypothetical protein
MITPMTIAEVLELPAAVDIATAGRAFGLSRGKSFELARAGKFPCPVLTLGNQYRVTKAGILKALARAQHGGASRHPSGARPGHRAGEGPARRPGRSGRRLRDRGGSRRRRAAPRSAVRTAGPDQRHRHVTENEPAASTRGCDRNRLAIGKLVGRYTNPMSMEELLALPVGEFLRLISVLLAPDAASVPAPSRSADAPTSSIAVLSLAQASIISSMPSRNAVALIVNDCSTGGRRGTEPTSGR